MSDEPAFQDLMGRVRAGDAAAAEALVRSYEPVLRRMVRVRLVGARLCRLFDSGDICQSVLASFFVRAALGQYDLRKADDLLRLLATMARNKVAGKRRRPGLDLHVWVAGLTEEAHASPDPGPVQQAALRDLVEEVRRRLSPGERRVLELRQQGLEWAEVAAQVGGSAEALRKRFARAVDLVAQELKLDEW